MSTKPSSVQEYLDQLPGERKEAFMKLRDTVLENLDPKFEERINYNMLGYVVPHSEFPDGYHCDPKLPLPFANLANQKNFIAFYHMGLYAQKDLHEWFVSEYPKHAKYKLDMGKSCIRFKKVDDIPFELIGELCQKMNVEEWISLYNSEIKSK
ncbi:MAG: DUF1801 domain-containing protein [Flavobacteriales bacterium]